MKHFSSSSPPTIYNIPSINYTAESLYMDIDTASDSIFPCRKSPHPHGVCW
jgi:hypothetical protein